MRRITVEWPEPGVAKATWLILISFARSPPFARYSFAAAMSAIQPEWPSRGFLDWDGRRGTAADAGRKKAFRRSAPSRWGCSRLQPSGGIPEHRPHFQRRARISG